MANRNRTNPVQFYLSDDEQYILTTNFKASGMKSMSAFLRKACTWAGRDNLLHINDSIPQISNYAMFLTEQKEPEMIKAKYQEIQELYPQVGFFLGQQLSNFLTKHT